jgi:hypothetical protein
MAHTFKAPKNGQKKALKATKPQKPEINFIYYTN